MTKGNHWLVLIPALAVLALFAMLTRYHGVSCTTNPEVVARARDAWQLEHRSQWHFQVDTGEVFDRTADTLVALKDTQFGPDCDIHCQWEKLYGGSNPFADMPTRTVIDTTLVKPEPQGVTGACFVLDRWTGNTTLQLSY